MLRDSENCLCKAVHVPNMLDVSTTQTAFSILPSESFDKL